jgi:5-methylcytosine-specific restriction endonuclease McrA
VTRHRDPMAVLRKLVTDPGCRGCGRRASEGHHIVLRSHGGDDDPDNTMPLCMLCHHKFHTEGHLAVALSWEEVAYAWRRLGVGFASYLERRYDWKEEVA